MAEHTKLIEEVSVEEISLGADEIVVSSLTPAEQPDYYCADNNPCDPTQRCCNCDPYDPCF
jgi:hypothetical protein